MRTDDLLRAMAILGIGGDPLYIMQDLDDDRRHAALLAHIAAALTERLADAEDAAGLDVDGRAELHWQSDLWVAGRDGVPALNAARLAWVQQTVSRQRGRRPDPVADAVATTLGVLTSLIGQERPVPLRDPMVADAVAALCAAADRLAVTLRGTPDGPP